MLLSDLEELEDILDDIIPEEEKAIFSTEEETDIVNTSI